MTVNNDKRTADVFANKVRTLLPFEIEIVAGGEISADARKIDIGSDYFARFGKRPY